MELFMKIEIGGTQPVLALNFIMDIVTIRSAQISMIKFKARTGWVPPISILMNSSFFPLEIYGK